MNNILLLTYIIVATFFPVNSKSLFGEDISFIRDFLLYRSKIMNPVPIDVFLCWNKSSMVQLHRMLSNAGFLVSINIEWNLYLHDDGKETVQYMIDTRCKGYETLLKKADQKNLFRFPQRWLLLSEEQLDVLEYGNDTLENTTDVGGFRNHLLKTLSSLKISVDSDVIIGMKNEEGAFRIMEVYKRSFTSELIVNVTGIWLKNIGIFNISNMFVLSIRRFNLHKTLLKGSMVVTDNDTLNHLTDYKDKHIDTITKLNYIMLITAMDMINATIDLTVDYTWGYATNGSWSGMVGHLQRHEADIGATGLFFTADRLPVIEYISVSSPTRASFVFRQPPLSYVANVFALPFNTSVWICSLMLLFVCGSLLYITFKWENTPRDSLNDPTVDKYVGNNDKMTWSEVVLLVISIVTEQGSPNEAQGIPGRIVSVFLFISVLFLYTSYSASIVALLQSSTDSIKTLEDLLKSRLELGVHDIVYNKYYFEKSTERIRRAIYIKKVAPPGQRSKFMTLDDGVHKIRKGFFAFHMEESAGYKMISETFLEDEKCGLQAIRGYIQVIDPWIAIQKYSPYREIFKITYRKILETGVQNREISRLYSKKPECLNKGSNFMSVGIVDCYPAVLIAVYGMLISTMLLVMEIISHRRKCFKSRTLKFNADKPYEERENI